MKRFVVFFLLLFCVFFYFFINRTGKTGSIKKIDKDEVVDCSIKVNLDLDICKFLNFEIPYTKDNISKQLLKSMGPDSVNNLGLVLSSQIEGLLIDYLEKDGYILLIVGFDDNNGGRFITLIKIPVYAISDSQSKGVFAFEKSENQDIFSKKEIIKLKNNNDITSYLDRLKKHVVVLYLVDREIDETIVMQVKYSNNESDWKLVTEINNSVIVNRSLLNEVYHHENGRSFDDFDYQLGKIKNESDIDNILIKKMPIVTSMIIFLDDNDL